MELKKKYLLATSAFSNSDLLEKCVRSWPESSDELDKIVFFDGENANEIFEDFFKNKTNECLNKHIFAGDHLGASGAWNKILEYAFDLNDYERVIIMGSDTEMTETFFKNFIKDLKEKNPDFSCCMGFNCFTMNKKCYETVGNFDENYFVFYYEDNDLDRRVRLASSLGVSYDVVGDESLLKHYGSATIRKNEKYNRANGVTFSMNQRYYVEKWGVKDLTKISECSYITPFNDPNLTIRDWKLDKEKYLQKKKIWKDIEDTNN